MRDTEETSAKQRYDSDVTDTEWDILGPVIESCQSQRRGRPLATDLREVLNAIFYLNKTGCPWRYLPKDFPDYRTVNYHYNKWRKDGTLAAVNDTLRELARKKTLVTWHQRQPSSIVRASRERQNQWSARALMEASSSRGESGIS